MFVVLGVRRCCVFEILMAGRRHDADMAHDNQRQE